MNITDRKTFEKVISWIKELKDQGSKNIIIVVAGNKCDIEKERQINRQEALKFCRKANIRHVDTSAKTGNGVNEAFECIAEQILESEMNSSKSKRKSRNEKANK